MARTVLDSFGRIVVPKAIRDRLGIVPGSELQVEEKDGAIVIRGVEDLPGLVEKDGVLVFRARPNGDLADAVRRHRADRMRSTGGLPS